MAQEIKLGEYRYEPTAETSPQVSTCRPRTLGALEGFLTVEGGGHAVERA